VAVGVERNLSSVIAMLEEQVRKREALLGKLVPSIETPLGRHLAIKVVMGV
jgi:hypothetical protein